MFATALALLSQEFFGRERGTAFGSVGSDDRGCRRDRPASCGRNAHLVAVAWRWIFLVNIPIGIGAVILGSAKLHESKDPEHGGSTGRASMTLSGGLFLLVLRLIEGTQRAGPAR